MAKTNGYYGKWWSEDCADGDGYCDGTIPEWDEDAAGIDCQCECHMEDQSFNDNESVREFHRAMNRIHLF